jgi:hypothetical protein
MKKNKKEKYDLIALAQVLDFNIPDEIPKAEDFENTIADYLTFEFNMIMQGKSYLFENAE